MSTHELRVRLRLEENADYETRFQARLEQEKDVEARWNAGASERQAAFVERCATDPEFAAFVAKHAGKPVDPT